LSVSAAATLRNFAANQIADASAVSVLGDTSATGLWDLNNQSETIGPLSLTAGTITSGSGTLTLGSNVTATAASGIMPRASLIDGALALGAASRIFSVSSAILVDSEL